MNTRSSIRRLAPCLLGGAIAFSLAPAALAADATGCAPGTRCLTVEDNGAPGTGATAQCTGRFPDFIVDPQMLENFAGPWFTLAQNFPASAPTNDAPWLAIDFKNGTKGANDYLYALRDYSFEGMIEADFVPAKNTVRPWFHMPMMNFDPKRRREAAHGVTAERTVVGPELGVKPGKSIRNFAVGFYNAAGGAAIGAVWKSDTPDITKARFAKGTMTFKILFSDATAADFSGPDLMEGAPEWTILTNAGPKKIRLLQMDVSAADPRSPTGWVFGTFAYDRAATDASPWKRLRPLGLSWGNDPGYTPADQAAGKKLKETIISDQIPAYAAGHLGWAGRANGPVDNPISGCLSCHGTAQYPAVAALAPFDADCNTDAKKLRWFRNFKGTQAFGAIAADTCLPKAVTPAPRSLDFSLQMQVAVVNVLQTKDKNPCTMPGATPPSPAAKLMQNIAPLPAGVQGGGRIQR
jgi:hypothetical protein